MTTDEKILRMQQLVQELNEASDAYYNGQAERMTDYEWDARPPMLCLCGRPVRWRSARHVPSSHNAR